MLVANLNTSALREAMVAAGLESALVAELETLAAPALRLQTQAAEEASLQLGQSKLGGRPDLPAAVSWPTKENEPLAFIGQIALSEAHPYDVQGQMPDAGLLSFFYDAKQETYGTEPADRAGFAVLYTPAEAGQLVRLPFPAALPTAARYTACALQFANILTLPDEPAAEMPSLAWSDALQQRYEQAKQALTAPGTPNAEASQILGYPITLQDDMRLQCQLATTGIRSDTATSEQIEANREDANNWTLLLQVDADTQTGMQWSDGGMLYYWIQRDALVAANVSNVWCILQTT